MEKKTKTVKMGTGRTENKPQVDTGKLSYEQLEQLLQQYYEKANKLQQALAQAQTDNLNQALYASLEILKINNDKVEQLQYDAHKLAMFLFSKIESSVYSFFEANKEEEEESDSNNDLTEE